MRRAESAGGGGPDHARARLCYSPGFNFAVHGFAFAAPFGSFPKISTTVENTVENIAGRLSRPFVTANLQHFQQRRSSQWPVFRPRRSAC